MDLPGKAKRYVSKRLRQKGYGKNISQTRVPTIQELQRKAQSGQSQAMANSPFNVSNNQKLSVQKAEDPKYKSEFEWLFDPVRGVQWDYNPVQLRELAQSDAWVQMLVNTMTNEIANTPWQIVRDDDSEVAKSSGENLNPFERVSKGVSKEPDKSVEAKQAEKFFKKPNPDEDFTTFTEQIVADLLEIGSLAIPKMFAESDYDGEELVADDPELVHAKPSDPITWTKEYANKHGMVTGYWQYDNNTSHRQRRNTRRSGRSDPTHFKPQEVAWKDINSRSNRRYGLPPTLAVRDFLMLIDLTIQQEQDYWSRGAFPAGFIKSDGDIEEIEFLKDEAQGEQGRQGGIMHIGDKEADYVQMAYNWKDMEMNEREKWYAKVIAAAFQVPVSVVGLKPEEVNRSTFEGERDNFESNTLGPYLQDLERLFTNCFVKPYFSEDLRFEFIPGMSENQKSSISDRALKEWNNDGITRNEFRKQLGYNAVDEEKDGFKSEVVEEPEPANDQNLQDQLQLSSFNKEDDCGCDVVGKPFGPWENWDDCVSYMQSEQDYDKETAEQVCGSLQAELKDKDLSKMSKSEAKLEIEKSIEKALVEKQESFTDYPDAAVENAQMALDAKEDTGDPNDCGTDTGWARANQLANREPVSRDTVERMAQFNRHRDNSEMSDEEGRADCGWMMWKAWGGDEGVDWAIKKVDELENEDAEKSCEQCGDTITKDENKRFCSKSCYNDFLSKDNDEPLRSDEEYFKYDFQPRHVEQFKQELQEPINESLKAIFRDDRFNQLIERFAELERNDNTSKNSAELRRILNDLIKDVGMTAAMESVIQDQSTSIAVTALQDQIADTGLDADIDEVTNRLQKRNLNFVDNFSQRMEEELRNTVSQGWQQGQSIQEIQENLQSKADDLSDNQAERIARDQLQRATGEARNEFANQHSDKFVEVWNSVEDSRTRPSHSEMNGKWKRPNESFEVPYERANGMVKEKFPGDSEYGIQCRCRTDLVDIDSVSQSDYAGDQ